MKNERGFTLIELLVVIAILAVLFGVTALALVGVGSNAETEAKKGELDVVQTAIDVYMAENNASTVISHTLVTDNPTTVGPTTGDFGTYLRRVSKYYYCWDGSGGITQQDADATGNCPGP